MRCFKLIMQYCNVNVMVIIIVVVGTTEWNFIEEDEDDSQGFGMEKVPKLWFQIMTLIYQIELNYFESLKVQCYRVSSSERAQ